MNRKHLVVSVCLALFASAFVVSLSLPSPKAALPSQSGSVQRVTAPDAVVYSALFHHVVAVKEEAEETELQGKSRCS